MIDLKITIEAGNIAEEIARDIDKLEQELAYRIVEESRALMDSSTPHGRLYRRGRFMARQSRGLSGSRARGPGSRIHRASAPGQPPAEDTGKLYREITVRRLKSGHYRVRFGARYAGYLEFGTSRMAARPFVLPAIDTAVRKTFAKYDA
jgi:HK97 gp10 family phage protein